MGVRPSVTDVTIHIAKNSESIRGGADIRMFSDACAADGGLAAVSRFERKFTLLFPGKAHGKVI